MDILFSLPLSFFFAWGGILISLTVDLGFRCPPNVLILASVPASVLVSFWVADQSLVGFMVISKGVVNFMWDVVDCHL